MGNPLPRLAANLVAVALIIVGAALWRAALPAPSIGVLAIGVLLLLDVGGAFERRAAIAARIVRRRGPAQVIDLASARRAWIASGRRRRSSGSVPRSSLARADRIVSATRAGTRAGISRAR